MKHMKAHLIALLPLLATTSSLCPATSFAETDPKLAESVEYAFENGHDKAGYDMLYRALLSSYSLEIGTGDVDDELVRLAYSSLTNRIQFLSEKTVLTNISTRANLKHQESILKAARQKPGKRILKAAVGGPLVAADSIEGDAQKIQKQKAAAQEFKIPQQKLVSETLDQYEELKQFVQNWIDLEEQQAATLRNVQRHLKTKKHLERIKEEVIDERTRFLSYVAFSPVLAETSKRLTLAKKKWGRHSKGKVRGAIDYLATHSETKWVEQSNREVRKQFLDFLKELKEMVGKAELQDLETRAAILKSDSDKSIGGKSWWP